MIPTLRDLDFQKQIGNRNPSQEASPIGRKSYSKIRFGDERRQLGVGKATDPVVLLLDRYQRLEHASKTIYLANAEIEQRQYDCFASVWSLASRRLSHDFDSYLLDHGITRSFTGKLERMDTTSTPNTASCTMTEQALQDLIERVSKDDTDAVAEFQQLLKTDPSKWLAGQDLLSIAKREIYRCIAAQDTVYRIILEEQIDKKLDLLTSAIASPFEALIVEHIQISVLSAQYNRLMLIDDRRSMRERDSLERRAENADSCVKTNLKMFHELKMLVNSNWTMLPSELPLEALVNRRRPTSNVSEDYYDTIDAADVNRCSVMI
jgi:hypothetical protein